ncbi:sulfate adenylyltransferase [Geodermatophilus sp. SYSU D01036]
MPGPPPHGGVLVDLRVRGDRAAEVAAAARALPAWELSRRQRCDLELLATGGFSPLRTFMGPADHASVCDTMRLASGELWPVPVTLDVPEHVVEVATAAGGLTLQARGVDLAVLWLETAWQPDRVAESSAVLGSTDPSHPGVRALLYEAHPWCVSGSLEVLALPAHSAFRALRHTPAEVRREIADRGWERVVAFQTRNPMHRAHQELTLRAARDLDADLLLHPVVGVTKPGDVDPYVRVRCYRALLPTYPPGSALLSVLPLAMRMAGPREALWHAIVRKNHGATHFIVGRDHAGPGPDARGRPFYDPYAAQDLVRRHERELGIGVVPFRQMVYVRELQQYVPEDEVRPGQHCLRISGTEQRRRLAAGEELPGWFTPPEVAAELRRAFPPRAARGLGVLVGPGSGHPDRVAAAVAARLREAGRTVTVLDGAVGEAAGAASRLVVRLVGEVMRNGGAVVASGGPARWLADHAVDVAASAGPFLLDVRAEGAARGVGDGATSPGDDRASLSVPPEAPADVVAELVCRRLVALGHLTPLTDADPAPEPVAAPAARPVPTGRAALVGSG